MKPNSNTTLLVIALVVVAAGAYWYFSSSDEGEQATLTATGAENVAETQFQVLISELQAVSFDAGIFSDARFMVLTDLTTPIAPEAPGRLDPFASITGVTGG